MPIERNGRLLELGWLIVSKLDKAHLKAVIRGRNLMLERVREEFGQFEWHMPIVKRIRPIQNVPEEPSVLLREGITEREIQRWDYTFVVTSTDLKSYYRPYARAVPSRAVNVAVLSLARLSSDKATVEHDIPKLSKQLAERVSALCMHLLGDLNGLSHDDDITSFMYQPVVIGDLDRMKSYSQDQREQLMDELIEVADIRLEERPQSQKSRTLPFYLKGSWIGRHDIFSAVVQANPWEFPFRLNRLTTAAISAMLILLVTAEAWDLGTSQSTPFILCFPLVVLVGTSIYILTRQKLLLRRPRRTLTEQTVITNVSISIVVVLGMSTTYLMLFLLTLLLSGTVFHHMIIQSWAVSLSGQIKVQHYLMMASFVASFGILIGALGSSFEGQEYFRHITYVDEET